MSIIVYHCKPGEIGEIFSLDLKTVSDELSRTVLGSEFQTAGARGVATFAALGGRAMIWGAYDSK